MKNYITVSNYNVTYICKNLFVDISIIKEWCELLSYAATIVGIPLAIFVYSKDKILERKRKEKEVLFTSHTLYVDYLKLCLTNPELDIFNSNFNNNSFSENEKKEIIIFEILFTYLESTFLYYSDLSDEIKMKRWAGWESYIKEFSENDNFIKAWRMTEGQWDLDFMNFMNRLLVQK
ncbi:MAG: hypothetical protein ABIY50_13050 [Ignavibacteria bacterium]